MKAGDIWKLPTHQRLAAFIDRWEELAEHIGNRTPSEFHEMAVIADAVIPELIRVYDFRHPRHPTRNAAASSAQPSGPRTFDPAKCDHGTTHHNTTEFDFCENCDPERWASLTAPPTASPQPGDGARSSIWCKLRDREAKAGVDECGVRLPPDGFASGPDGDLVLYQAQADALARWLNDVVPIYEHIVVRAKSPAEPAPPVERLVFDGTPGECQQWAINAMGSIGAVAHIAGQPVPRVRLTVETLPASPAHPAEEEP